MKQLGILIFDEVEVLDFAGPFEVFSVANQLANYKILQVHTLSLDALEIRAKNGLHVVADQRLDQVGQLDYLVLPGGDGSKMYTRDGRVLSNQLELLQRVASCNAMVNAGWFPEEEGNVAAWLNQQYYHFEK